MYCTNFNFKLEARQFQVAPSTISHSTSCHLRPNFEHKDTPSQWFMAGILMNSAHMYIPAIDLILSQSINSSITPYCSAYSFSFIFIKTCSKSLFEISRTFFICPSCVGTSVSKHTPFSLRCRIHLKSHKAFVQYICIGPCTKLDLQCKAWENSPKFNQSGYSWTIFTRAHANIGVIMMISSTVLFFSLKNSKIQLYWAHSGEGLGCKG